MRIEEQLSRLLDGDLGASHARALRARIETEPSVAAAWERMQALALRLDRPPLGAPPEVRAAPGAFPTGVPPVAPPAPRARVSRAPMPPSPRSRTWALVPWGMVGFAAAAVAFVATRPPVITANLQAHETLLTGRMAAVVGDVRIEVDGKVRVTMEPAGGGPRGSGSESPDMDRSHAVAAVTGAAFTLAVVEGRAFLETADAAPRMLTAGQSATVPLSLSPSGPEGVDPADPAPSADARIAALQRELDKLRLEQALVRGQLTQATGSPQAFPADLPDAFRPDAFRRRLAEAASAHPAITLVETNCDEYPCLGVLRTAHEGEDWQDSLEAVLETMKADGSSGDSHAMEWISNIDTDHGELRMLVFTLWPEGGENAVAQTRTKFRAEDLLQSTAESLGDGE